MLLSFMGPPDAKQHRTPLGFPASGPCRFPRASFVVGVSTERKPIMPTGTVRLHRVLKAKAERVYRAFLDADAMAKWLPPHGFTCSVHHFEGKVGGTFRMSFRNFTTGN